MSQYFVALRHDPTIWPNLKSAVQGDNFPTIQFKDGKDDSPTHAIVTCTAVSATEFGFVRFTPDWPENRKGEPPEHLIVHPGNVLWIVESEQRRGPIGFAIAGA